MGLCCSLDDSTKTEVDLFNNNLSLIRNKKLNKPNLINAKSKGINNINKNKSVKLFNKPTNNYCINFDLEKNDHTYLIEDLVTRHSIYNQTSPFLKTNTVMSTNNNITNLIHSEDAAITNSKTYDKVKLKNKVFKSKANNTTLNNVYSMNYNLVNYNKNKEKLIDKLRIDQLWNIYVNHQGDFTNSDYIVFDLRNKKINSFMYSFKHINYNINEIINHFNNCSSTSSVTLTTTTTTNNIKITENSNINNPQNNNNNTTVEDSIKFKQRFIKYIENKIIIIFFDNIDTIISIDEFINIIKLNDIKVYIRIFDNDMLDNASLNCLLLTEYLDKRIGYYLPNILLSLQYLPNLQSNKFIFMLDNVPVESIIDMFINNNSTVINNNNNNNDNNINSQESFFNNKDTFDFLNKFELYSFLIVSSSVNIFDNNNNKRVNDLFEVLPNNLKNQVFLLPNINNESDLLNTNNLELLSNILNNIKDHIDNNNSVLIVIDPYIKDKLEEDNLYCLLMTIILYKLFKFNDTIIECLAKDNPILPSYIISLIRNKDLKSKVLTINNVNNNSNDDVVKDIDKNNYFNETNSKHNYTNTTLNNISFRNSYYNNKNSIENNSNNTSFNLSNMNTLRVNNYSRNSQSNYIGKAKNSILRASNAFSKSIDSVSNYNVKRSNSKNANINNQDKLVLNEKEVLIKKDVVSKHNK